MLITPLGLIGFNRGWNFEVVGLIIGWLFGYAASFYIGLTFKGWRNSAKRKRYLNQILIFSALGLALALPVVSRHPSLLWFVPIGIFGLLTNLYFIRNRDERNWINDLLGIVVSFALAIAYLAPTSFRAIEFLLWPFLYFVGTIFYVKTMIRERGKNSWNALSVGYHMAISVFAAIYAPLVLFGYLLLLVRAFVLPQRTLRPAVVGVIEIWLTLIISGLSLMC